MNKRLNFFVIKSFLGPFLATFVIAIFVLLMQWLWKYIDDLVGKGLEWNIVAQLLFWASTTMIPLALPLAILLSSIMTFGNLGEHYELVAIKSSGISLQRIMAPLAVTAILMSVAAFYFSNNMLPYANLKMGSLLYDVREQKPALSIKEGIFYNGIDGYVIKVGKKEADGITIHNVMIYDHTSRMGNTNLTLAETGKMEMTADKRYLLFTLINGMNYFEQPNQRSSKSNHPLQRTKFKEEYRRFDLSGFAFNKTNEEFFKDNYQMMNVSQLKETSDSLKAKLESVKIEYQKNSRNNFYFYNSCYRDSTIKDTSAAMSGSILSNFSEVEKIRIVDKALSMARGIKDHVFYSEDDLWSRQKFIIRHDIERHRKFTLAIACLVLFFIGAPLGAIIRKGGFGLPIVVSVVFFVIFHVVSFTFEKMVREGVLPVYVGMWLPSLIFLPIGIILTIKATSDSSLFDTDSYVGFFNRILARIRVIKLQAKKS
jgi:lipopolysaccharide export system permease protein